MKGQRITPGAKIPVRLSHKQRDPILDHTFAGRGLAHRLVAAGRCRLPQPRTCLAAREKMRSALYKARTPARVSGAPSEESIRKRGVI